MGRKPISENVALNVDTRRDLHEFETRLRPTSLLTGEVDAVLAPNNGPYKAEVIHRRLPWRNFEAVEFAALEWWIGSTADGSWSLSATSRRPKPSNATALCWNNPPWRHNLIQMAFGKPGAVQSAKG